MGGIGSGRKPDPIKAMQRNYAEMANTVAEPVLIPNLSGVKHEISDGSSGITTDDLSEGTTNLYSQWSNNGTSIYYNGGNVGIGTGTPEGALDVNGNIYIRGDSGNGIINFDAADTARLKSGTGYFLSASATSMAFDRNLILFRSLGGGTEFARFDSNGRFGIGTASPSAPLHTYHATTNTLAIFESGDAIAGIALKDNSTTSNPGLYAVGNNFVIYTGGSEKLRLDGSGNLGIGTASPNAKLEVNSDKIIISNSKTPSSASDTGTAGTICWDSNYLYVCVATDTWKRAALSTW